jgi:hypothetical protein
MSLIKKHYFRTLIALFVLLVVLQINHPILAADNSNTPAKLVASPEKVAISAKIGQTVKGNFTLSNNGDLPVKLKIDSMDVKYSNYPADLEYYLKKSDSIGAWLIPEYLTISLKPQEQKTINYVVQVPKNIQPGGYNGAFVFGAADTRSVGPKNLFSVLVIMNISEKNKPMSARINIDAYDTKAWQSGNSANFKLTMKNPSTMNFIGQGSQIIKDWRGNELDKSTINNIIVYPNSSQTLNWSWDKPLAFGLYSAEIILQAGGKETDTTSKKIWFASIPLKNYISHPIKTLSMLW